MATRRALAFDMELVLNDREEKVGVERSNKEGREGDDGPLEVNKSGKREPTRNLLKLLSPPLN